MTKCADVQDSLMGLEKHTHHMTTTVSPSSKDVPYAVSVPSHTPAFACFRTPWNWADAFFGSGFFCFSHRTFQGLPRIASCQVADSFGCWVGSIPPPGVRLAFVPGTWNLRVGAAGVTEWCCRI